MCKSCEDWRGFNPVGRFHTKESGKEYSYDVYIFQNYLRVGEDQNKIVKISYCPMCGKKL